MSEDAEFLEWKRQKAEREVDDFAERVAKKLMELLGTDEDEGDGEEAKDMRGAAKKSSEGKKVKAPKEEPKEEEPVSLVRSIASRIAGDSAA